ncbi:MAG: DUF2309 domain-containing protein [Pseudomonadota bacterium]|nr:DUF2309 domain-containing protein [Pseudomonadota bacterium]
MKTVVPDYPQSVRVACQRIAPVWPLDQSIAVNPWWELRDQPIEDVAAELQALGQVNCLMHREYYRQQWQTVIKPEHLQAAIEERNERWSEEQLVEFLSQPEQVLPHWHNYSELLDALPDRRRKISWHDEIVQQISQFCGLYFQYQHYFTEHQNPAVALYRNWLEITRGDVGIEVLTAAHGLHRQFEQLPDDPALLCHEFMEALGCPENFADYAFALLLDIHGWASWGAYQQWQEAFKSVNNDWVAQLLAIRMAWELALWRHNEQQAASTGDRTQQRFFDQFSQMASIRAHHQNQQSMLWVWQRALELSYQLPLQNMLSNSTVVPRESRPLLQAAFCIDVRSEPMRRALEAQHPDIETLGFAGFFGLPLSYRLSGHGYQRPQLPGLLAPAIEAVQTGKPSRRLTLKNRHAHAQAESFATPSASFGMVEMLGAVKSLSLLGNSLMPDSPKHPVNDMCDMRPFVLSKQGRELSIAELTELAATVLRHMGLTDKFAPVVLLLGHGSETSNNPQAASLDCGACGGQTGEVNVKVLAQLLNDPAIRRGLAATGLLIPADTRFVAGLHNTTTDNIHCYGDALTTNSDITSLLTKATASAQHQRAGTLPGIKDVKNLASELTRRSRNWSEIQPEWGLANNAAFIVAPRAATRHLNLQGRTFLHDYHWHKDDEYKTLELIMSGPMIVTNWINLQYYASTVDNRLYGSGNKLLHNVVGEHIGVFEGNGGDLRIGLARQSLHDGEKWRHQPVRLAVYIAAPAAIIAEIASRHTAIEQLVRNGWMSLYAWDIGSGQVVPALAASSSPQPDCLPTSGAAIGV